jgi:hypothetical protein
MTNQIEPRRPRLTINRSPIPSSPVHPLAALATLLLDNVSFAVEALEIVDPFLLPLTWFTVGVIDALTVTLVQRYLAEDEWGPSIAKGLVMGIIAGVPTSVTGTAVGGLLLAWAGLHQWVQFPSSRDKSGSDDHEIIDLNPK